MEVYSCTVNGFTEELARKICAIITDYHNGKVKFDENHVVKWVSQFDENDQQFILEEFLYVLNKGIYISKDAATNIFNTQLMKLAEHFKFTSVKNFFDNAEFLRLQGVQKSQSILLNIMDEEMKRHYNLSIRDCGKTSTKYSVYIDDIICTGNTVFDTVTKWLEAENSDGETNLSKLANQKKVLIVSLLCKHTWAVENLKIRLKIKYNDDRIINKIGFQSHYTIENHPSIPIQKFNLVYPVRDNQPESVINYFNNLPAVYKAEFAFRKAGTPEDEGFYSSAENRMRFENIILNKGIELLKQAKSVKPNHRPLGMTNPTKKILGTGTLFFAWNNVSNTTPIVFWWKVNWYPLFPLDNRGN